MPSREREREDALGIVLLVVVVLGVDEALGEERAARLAQLVLPPRLTLVLVDAAAERARRRLARTGAPTLRLAIVLVAAALAPSSTRAAVVLVLGRLLDRDVGAADRHVGAQLLERVGAGADDRLAVRVRVDAVEARDAVEGDGEEEVRERVLDLGAGPAGFRGALRARHEERQLLVSVLEQGEADAPVLEASCSRRGRSCGQNAKLAAACNRCSGSARAQRIHRLESVKGRT